MMSKLTLSLKKDFITKAKYYAKSQQKTLSGLIKESLEEKMETDISTKRKLSAFKNSKGILTLENADSLEEKRYESIKNKQ